MIQKWFNQRTKQWEVKDAVGGDYRDYIPQTEAALGLYQTMLDLGHSALDAAIYTLEAVCGAPHTVTP